MVPPDEWAEIERIFGAACRLAGAERSAFLENACRQQPALRAEVDSLLSCHDSASRFLEVGEARSSPPQLTRLGEMLSIGTDSMDPDSIDTLVGTRIGSCRITRLIARGGMGVVYEATQETPHREVAVKVLRAGFDTPSLLRRFEYEAEVLGHLSHPGIAQVYEVGTFDSGGGRRTPYFVMELVSEARTLAQYVEAEKPELRERLRLFTETCGAVHHGHQKGIVHRDLKPANILVDAAGHVKVIDFGVARATGSELAPATLQTSLGQIIGTLPYMSPEQCKGDSRDIDVRSDVYSLGVVLYELLCGRLPYEIESSAIHEAVRVIQEVRPHRPSTTRVELRGDLETIVLKALEKDRERRFTSAAELAEDIRSFLHHQPIKARPPSLIYNVRLFAHRHKLAFGAACVAALSLILATIVSLVFWRQAEVARGLESLRAAKEQAARERAERLFTGGKSLAAWVLGELDNRVASLAGSTPVRKGLIENVQRYLETLSKDAVGDKELERDIARAWERIGRVQGAPAEMNLGQPRQAVESCRRALVIFERLSKESPESVTAQIDQALSSQLLAEVLQATGATQEHLELLLKSKALLESACKHDEVAPLAHANLAGCLRKIAKHHISMGQIPQAREHFDAALRAAERALELGDSTPKLRSELALAHAELGNLLRMQNQNQEAAAEYRKFWNLLESFIPEASQSAAEERLLSTMSIYLGDALWEEKNFEGALQSYETARRLDAAHAAADPANAGVLKGLALSTERIGYGLAGSGKRKEAVEAFLRSAEINERLLVSDPKSPTLARNAAMSRGLAAQSLVVLGELDRAREELLTVLKAQEAILETQGEKVESHSDVAVTCGSLAQLHSRLAAAAKGDVARIESLRESRKWYLRAAERYQAMKEKGLLIEAFAHMPGAIADAVAQLEQQIAKAEESPPGSK